MLKLNSITFKDDETGKIIEVHVDGQVTSDCNVTYEEYFNTSLYSGIILGGGLSALYNFIREYE